MAEELTPDQAFERFKKGSPLIDVREDHERATQYIEGSEHYPLSSIEDWSESLPEADEVLLVCAGGVRSLKAASYLEQNGFSGTLISVQGGLRDWTTAGLPVRDGVDV